VGYQKFKEFFQQYPMDKLGSTPRSLYTVNGKGFYKNSVLISKECIQQLSKIQLLIET